MSPRRGNWPVGALAVSVEGIDGAGKSLLVDTLERELLRRGVPVLALREFSSPIGAALRSSLREMPPVSIAYAFAAERHWLLERSRREDARLLVWDRYVDSAVACRTADVKAGRCGEDMLAVVEQINEGLPLPHLTVRLRVPLDVAASRVQSRQQRLGLNVVNDITSLAAQDEAYDEIMRGDLGRFIELDAELASDTLAATLADELCARLARDGAQ